MGEIKVIFPEKALLMPSTETISEPHKFVHCPS